jgi:hypothetical protein
MPNTLAYYIEQRDQALQQAESDAADQAGWQRIAQEWQKLIDAFSANPGAGAPEDSSQHVLDS